MASSLPRAAAAVLVAVAVVGWWSGRNAVVEAAPAGDDRPQAETIGVGGDQDQVLVDVNEWPVNGRGDIVQLWPEAELLTNEVMRNALKQGAENRWTELVDPADGKFVVPYIISGNFNKFMKMTTLLAEKEHAIIQGAIYSIGNNSCVKFRPHTDEPDFVDIQNEEHEGCYTMVGRLPGNNVVMLETGKAWSCVSHSTATHELFHKIGLWHEQSRYDRDEGILVRYENIPRWLWPQFRKVSQNLTHIYGVKYDYTSVMHYGKTAGSVSRDKLAIQTRDPAFQDRIGKSSDASPGDYKKICSIYKCPQCQGQPFKTDPDELCELRKFEEKACSFPLVPAGENGDKNCKPGGWLNPHDYPYLYEIHCCELPDDIESGKLTTTTTTTTTTASTAAGPLLPEKGGGDGKSNNGKGKPLNEQLTKDGLTEAGVLLDKQTLARLEAMLADAVVRANSEATQKQREQAADGGKPADVGGGVVDEARKLLSAAIV